MVPCLGCGRSFCRVCDAPKGAGQYCPACYRTQVEKLTGKAASGEPGEPGEVERATVSRLRDRLRGKRAPRGEKRPRGNAGRIASAPFRWAKKVALAAGAWIMSAAVYVSYLPKRFALLVAAGARRLSHEARDHFPLGLAPRELLEGDPPFRRAWWKLLLFVLGGAALWTVLVGLTGMRNPGFSIGVSVVIAACVVWAMGTKYGLTVAVICAGLALLSMAFGELTAQLLYRANIIDKLDVQTQSLWTLDKPVFYYQRFYFKLIVWRLLPSVVAAFLIGWWPLKLRLSWAGFAGGRLEPLPPREKKAERAPRKKREPSPGRREKKAAGTAAGPEKELRVKELPRQAVSAQELREAMRRAEERDAAGEAPGGGDGE